MPAYTGDCIWEHAESRIMSLNPPTPLARISVFFFPSSERFSLRSRVIGATASVAADRSEEILESAHNSEKRSAFNGDYLSLSLQSANCTLIVLHKKPVKFINCFFTVAVLILAKGINKISGAWGQGTNQWLWSQPRGCDIRWSLRARSLFAAAASPREGKKNEAKKKKN